MEIEKEIHQKKFKNETQKLVVNLAFTASWLQAEFSKKIKPFEVSGQQYNILRILRGRHPGYASNGYITERMMDKMSNSSRLVEKLRSKGLVERIQCPVDRRAVEISITSKGMELLGKLDKLENEAVQTFKTLSDPEKKEMNRLLNKLRG